MSLGLALSQCGYTNNHVELNDIVTNNFFYLWWTEVELYEGLLTVRDGWSGTLGCPSGNFSNLILSVTGGCRCKKRSDRLNTHTRIYISVNIIQLCCSATGSERQIFKADQMCKQMNFLDAFDATFYAPFWFTSCYQASRFLNDFWYQVRFVFGLSMNRDEYVLTVIPCGSKGSSLGKWNSGNIIPNLWKGWVHVEKAKGQYSI